MVEREDSAGSREGGFDLSTTAESGAESGSRSLFSHGPALALRTGRSGALPLLVSSNCTQVGSAALR
jgi:hypothetical protein